MKAAQTIIIQVCGSGKGCGKTSLICRLIPAFSSVAFVKTALHFDSESPHGGDDKRAIKAGARFARMVPGSDFDLLVETINEAFKQADILFLERNSPIPGMTPQLKIFLESEVVFPRDDRLKNRETADLIIDTWSIDEEELEKIIRKLNALVAGVA